MTKTPSFCDIKLNDRVLCLLPVEQDARFETFANVPFDSAIKVDKYINPMVQVSIVLTYLPALQILQSLPYKVKNKKVLLNGGIGPVNRSLISLCILHRAHKIYVPCEKKYRKVVREFGGQPTGPRHSDWGPSYIGELDLAIDGIGENSYATSKAVLNEKGYMCIIGHSHHAMEEDGVFKSLNKRFVDHRNSKCKITTVFSLLDSLNKDRKSFIEDFEYLSDCVTDGRLEPMFTRVSLDEYRKSERSKATMLNAPIICDSWTKYKWT